MNYTIEGRRRIFAGGERKGRIGTHQELISPPRVPVSGRGSRPTALRHFIKLDWVNAVKQRQTGGRARGEGGRHKQCHHFFCFRPLKTGIGNTLIGEDFAPHFTS